MRILVVSDTHGDEGALQRAVQAQPSARTVIHLGDGAREAEAVAARFPDRMFWQVRGNGDFALGSAGLLYAREETLGMELVVHLNSVHFLQRKHLQEM